MAVYRRIAALLSFLILVLFVNVVPARERYRISFCVIFPAQFLRANFKSWCLHRFELIVRSGVIIPNRTEESSHIKNLRNSTMEDK